MLGLGFLLGLEYIIGLGFLLGLEDIKGVRVNTFPTCVASRRW